jgi:hypothetical protein
LEPCSLGKTVHISIPSDDQRYARGDFVLNQGTVSGSNFRNLLTDDPAVGGAKRSGMNNHPGDADRGGSLYQPTLPFAPAAER